MTGLDEIEWAATYNGYDRLCGGSNDLYDKVLQPAMEEYRQTGRVPSWCGVDLLRGWAFYLFRADYFLGGGSLGREWDYVLDAVRRHPAASEADLPPGR